MIYEASYNNLYSYSCSVVIDFINADILFTFTTREDGEAKYIQANQTNYKKALAAYEEEKKRLKDKYGA